MFRQNKFLRIWKQKQRKLKRKFKAMRQSARIRSIFKLKPKAKLSPNEKKKLFIKRLKIRSTIFLLFLLSSVVVFFVATYIFVLKDLPNPKKLTEGELAVSTEIYDRNGILLYEIFADENRKPILLADLPDHVKQATIAIEDKDFYKHGGFAIRGIVRAVYKNIKNNDIQGGSTITQQLVKVALLSPEQTIQRKIKEIVLSTMVEFIYSKDEILEMYLNQIPYGGTAYGIEQASKLYFDKSAKDLTLTESTLLAGLPQAPSKYSPFGAKPELAKDRQTQVLRRMVEDKYITQAQADTAAAEKLNYAVANIDIKAPHFVFYVKDKLIEQYGEKLVEQGGLRVTTSLDLALQEYAQASVSAEIDKLSQANVTNGAVLVTKPATGEILAMVGSRDYFSADIDGNVNLTTALRQPGSSIKPLNYALGLAKGYTASMIFLDIPTCFTAPGQPAPYCPKNYDGGFHGTPSMRASLANSYNIPAVKMLALNSLPDFIATATAMGITTWTDPSRYGLSLTLGGGEVYMTDMATAYGVFANSGIKIDLNPILKIINYKGEVLQEHDHINNPPAGKRVIPAEVSFILSDILADNNARIPSFTAYSDLHIPGKTVSVKTGTTDNLRDNWTVGYTPEFLTAVWVGNNDNSQMNGWVVSGVTGASPIWNAVMTHILENKEDVIPSKPENVIGMNVCGYNNQASAECQGRYEYFIKGTETNALHAKFEKKGIWVDKATQRPPNFGQSQEGLDLELQEKTVSSDYFSKEYCLDCNHSGEGIRTIDMTVLEAEMRKLEEEKIKKAAETKPPLIN